nr:alpha/beta hydrolase [Pseudomaricurvus alkylphenolicus]
MVILPGMAVPWQSYIKAAQLLCKSFHLFIVTQRGHDITGWASDRSYHVSDYGSDVTSLIREVIRKPVVISGHSLGGLVALWVASTQRDIVIGFNAEDGAFLVNERERWESGWVKPMFVGLEQRVRAYHEQGASLDVITKMFSESRVILPSVNMSYDRRIIALGKSLQHRGQMPPLSDTEREILYSGYRKYLSGTPPTNAEFWPKSFLAPAAQAGLNLDPEVVRSSVSAELSENFDNRKAFALVRVPMLYWESDREMVGVLSRAEHTDLVDIVRRNGQRVKHVYAEGNGHRIHFDAAELFAKEIIDFFY